MNGSPFILIPWQANFIQTLLDTALERGGLENALFVFPHSRPARYLERLISLDARIPKPCLLPQMLPVGKIFQKIWAETNHPAQTVGLLDQAGLLLDCVRAEQKDNPGLISQLPTNDAAAFFPWGVRLAGLFEECFIHNRPPSGFLHLEDELLPFAAAILSRLSSLYARYIEGMEARKWTTAGLTAQKAVTAFEKGHRPGLLSAGKQIYLAGFYSLNGTENILFKKLWREHGATVLVHADPALPDYDWHWSCTELESWRKSWKAKWQVAGPAPAAPVSSKVSFYGGYDVHTQLAVLREELAERRGVQAGKPQNSNQKTEYELEDTAIILPDASLLMPVLHHIDTADINISMGYPLTNTALSRFFESILALHENSRAGGNYWKDCIQLLRQPYVKMLDDFVTENGRRPWRELLLHAESSLRQGRRYVDLYQTMQEALESLDSGEYLTNIQQLCESFRLAFIKSWEEADSLSTLAQALDFTCSLLLEKGSPTWPRFPIDAECLYRFMQFVLPEIRNSAMAEEKLPRATLFSIFRELLRAERVPFDAYPLTALQVMGLLESRLLNFKKVFILEATDDLMPGGISNDPLLPDNLRVELGLPNSARRQQMNAYYFFRLLHGAESVHILWQEGVESKGLQEGKKLKSRFVEELLWQQEQKLGRQLKPQKIKQRHAPGSIPLLQDGPLHQVVSSITPIQPRNRVIAASPAALASLKNILGGNISATILNRYLNCPAQFYYRDLARVKPLSTVNEGEDPAAVGNLLHNVLRDFYASKLGRPILPAQLSKTELINTFQRSMQGDKDIDVLPADVKATLSISGPRSLGLFLDNQQDETTVLALEASMFAPLNGSDGATYQLHGLIDRLDKRMRAGSESQIILDYKTGRINAINSDFWGDTDIWPVLNEERPDYRDKDFFNLLAEQVKDIQLPMYLYLTAFGQLDQEKGIIAQPFTGNLAASNAAWVELRDGGAERLLLPDSMPQDEKVYIIENKIELLLNYLLVSMRKAENFAPRPGKRCEYCDYAEICIVL